MKKHQLFCAIIALAGTTVIAPAKDFIAPQPPVTPATPEALAKALATPVDKRSEEQKAIVYAKIQADNRARFEAERLKNVEELATVRKEKVDLTKLLDGKLTDANGAPVSIDSIKKARFVAFYHSATWCCGCHVFTPIIQKAAAKYKPEDIAFVLVSWDRAPELTQKYMKKSAMSWPSTPKGTLAESPAGLAIRCIPHLRVYDAAGSLVADSLDNEGKHLSYDQQLTAIDKLINSPADSPSAKE